MDAEIISIGDELLIGQVVNTNASWMAQRLNETGLTVRQITAVSDDGNEIRRSVDEAFSRSEIILLTGGLGPTRDDITKHTLCEYFGTRLRLHEPTLEHIRKMFDSRGWTMNDLNRRQAEVPEACTPLLNRHGTAPGMWFEQGDRILVSLPGVPFEMEALMELEVMPRLIALDNSRVIAHKTVLTQGVGESVIAERIRDWELSLPENMKLAYLPQPGIVRLRLTAFAAGMEEARRQIDGQMDILNGLIPDLIFGYGEESLEQVVGGLLKAKGKTLVTAESCTGGYLAHLITSVPGSSAWFNGSAVAYANRVKEMMLGVSPVTLAAHGAVSREVVLEMASGARTRLGADYALAISGIAGPDGGTPDKPVGTVWIALAGPGRAEAHSYLFGDHRGRNIRRAALAALNIIRLELLKS
jgi:nicotinamide-nucleotide amidase